MRATVVRFAVLTALACGSPKTQRPVGPGAMLPADNGGTSSDSVVSPDGSVRRARPGEISTGRAPLPSECEGDACGVVNVTWLDPGYRFANTSMRHVVIKIWFVAKEDCVREAIDLAPGKNSGWGNVGFCKPYGASYE
jgi:hypothetical protein